MSMQMRILDVAEDLVRKRGYNGFSYSDIAHQVATSKAAIHHHFPKKADLGLELIERFTNVEVSAMAAIARTGLSSTEKLSAYFHLYNASLAENKMCLCGIMAAEHESLTDALQQALMAFFDMHVRWLSQRLNEGCSAGEIAIDGPVEDHAQTILSTMQGALMIAKATNDQGAINRAGRALLDRYGES